LLTITGRASDVINRGGVVVAPEYIEEAIRLRPGISDVAVFGVIGAGGIEEIWAAVVSSQRVDAASLIAALRPSLNERAPDRVIQVEAIPRGDTGKVQRSVLRERAAAMPGA
jgi:acyl-CoA synthetase (AMP-forming)/AMP-acid ligase II